MRTIAETSSVLFGKQTMSGAAGVCYDSSWLCCSRTAAESVARVPSSCRRSSIAVVVAVSTDPIGYFNSTAMTRDFPRTSCSVCVRFRALNFVRPNEFSLV